MDNTYRFLSQVGEYAMALNRKVAEGGTISDSERETLEKLLALSRSLCGQLATVSMHLDNGTLELEQARAALSEGGEGVQALSLSKSFADTEQALADYPTLIYDGPFSDHINQKNPAMLHGKAILPVRKRPRSPLNSAGLPLTTYRRIRMRMAIWLLRLFL